MSFNVQSCKWVIWGAKDNPYNTFSHIHQAFYRALKYLGKDVQWLEWSDSTADLDLDNTLFLSMNTVVAGMPRRGGNNCFYVVHNIRGDERESYFDGLPLLATGVHITPNVYSKNVEVLGKDIYFERDSRTLQMRWGTDLLPPEIEANKPTRVFNSDSWKINYIGTVDPMKEITMTGFIRACKENGIQFNTYGGFNQREHVSVQEHVRLVKDSYMAPAFQGMDQVQTGYISCRLFKAISAGQFGVTHSPYANELFDNKLIYEPDGYKLFYHAREKLQDIKLEELHSLMDIIARDHTYIPKVKAIEYAVRALENR